MNIKAGDWLHLNKKIRSLMLEKKANTKFLANKKKLLNLKRGVKQRLTYTNLLYHKIRRLREQSRFRPAVCKWLVSRILIGICRLLDGTSNLLIKPSQYAMTICERQPIGPSCDDSFVSRLVVMPSKIKKTTAGTVVLTKHYLNHSTTGGQKI